MEEKMINHQTGTFSASQGSELFQQSWIPEGEIKAHVILFHGLAEHSGRYEHVARFLGQEGYGAYTFDIRNHGKSGDHSIYVNSFDDFLADADVFIANVRRTAQGKPLFLMGHSMGGTIATLYCITRKPDFLNGVILSAPAVKMGNDISPLLVKISGILSVLTPHLKTIVLDNHSISHDPQVVQWYNNDPLNYRGGIPARTGAELNRAVQRIQADMEAITQPVLIVHGEDDPLVDINGSRMLYERVSSLDKTFKSYPGFYHEVMNEVQKEIVLRDIGDWIKKHLGN